jgi:hypothetical protein
MKKTAFQKHLREFNDFLKAQNHHPLSESEYTNLCDDEQRAAEAYGKIPQALEGRRGHD